MSNPMTDITLEQRALVLELAPRAAELADRLVASGPKAAHVSASETHEISEFVHLAIEALRLSAGADRALPAPVESGWHWRWDGEVFEMHFVQRRPGHNYLGVQEDDATGKRHFRMADRMRGQWFGPIKPPTAAPRHETGEGV